MPAIALAKNFLFNITYITYLLLVQNVMDVIVPGLAINKIVNELLGKVVVLGGDVKKHPD